MSRKKKARYWVALWLAVGMTVGVGIPTACKWTVDYVGWLIGSNCWKALIQLEQLKSHSSLLQPATDKDGA